CNQNTFENLVQARSALTSSYITKVTCSIRSITYPIFEERLALNWQTFLAQLGGSLGLYLGISFASLLHIPVFMARQVWFQLSGSNKKQKQQSIELQELVMEKFKQLELELTAVIKGELADIRGASASISPLDEQH